MIANILSLTLCLLLGLVLLISGFENVTGLADFSQRIHQHEILPPITVPFLAAVVALLELLIGLLLLAVAPSRRLARFGLAVSAGFFLSICVYLLSVTLIAGGSTSCGCSASLHTDALSALIRGSVVVVVATLVSLPWKYQQRSPHLARN
jgi:uncharacterized membrane protein YphA (DoxX/SURF4 family)